MFVPNSTKGCGRETTSLGNFIYIYEIFWEKAVQMKIKNELEIDLSYAYYL